MPAANRPRRSTRTSKRLHRTPSSDRDEQEKGEEDEEHEHEFNDDIIDTDEESFQDKRVKSKSSTRLAKKMKSIKGRQQIIQQQQEESSQPEQKPKEEKPTIPKRKRDSSATVTTAAGSETLESPSAAPEEIKRKKKDESNASELASIRNVEKQRPTSSSLIANMAPVDTKKLQPSIKDWKSKEDYQQQQQQQMSRNRESRPFGSKSVVGGNVGSSGGNQPPSLITKSDVVAPSYNAQPQPSSLDVSMMQEDDPNKRMNVNASHGDTLKEFECFNKILFDFNQVLFKVMESKAKKRTNDNDQMATTTTTVDLLNELVNDYNKPAKDKTPKNANVIDWNGSFLPSDNEEKFDFGNMDEKSPVPMLPEDFSSKSQHWPLSWWGVIPPSDELLDYHDGGSRSRRKRNSSREQRRRSSSRERRTRSTGSREQRRNSSRERSTTTTTTTSSSNRNKSDDRDRASRDDRRGRERSDRDRTSSKERSRRDKSDKDRASREGGSRDDKSDRDRSSRERSSRDKSGKDRTSRERSSRDKSDRDRTSRERSSKGENERRKRGESSSRGRDGRHADIAHRNRQSREREFPRDRQDGRYSRDRGEFLGDKYDRDREFFDDRQARDREFFGNMQGREREFFREGPGPRDWRRDAPPFQGDGRRNINDRGPLPYADNHYGPTQPRDTIGWEDSRMYGDRGGRGGGGGRGNGWDGPGPGRPYGGAHGPGRPGQYPRR